jgi:CubicO group peptidase (beta-lactamase class C family)
MKKFNHPVICILICLFASFSLAAQKTDSIRWVLDSFYKSTPFSANILISKEGKIIFRQSYGYADYATKEPLKISHAFQIASVSKQFTAYGIMLLHNKHLVHYDSLIARYLAGFPYQNITIRHLLTHTSGLPDFWNSIRPYLDTTRSNGNHQMFSYLVNKNLPLQSEPGTRYAYSDIGYDLLAMIIEKQSGNIFDHFMKENIFQPLNMKNTVAHMVTDFRKIDHTQLATGHEFDPATGNYSAAHLLKKNNFVFYLGDFYGDGSVVSTVEDLHKWNNALRNCTLLSCEKYQEALIPFTNNGVLPRNRNNTEMRYGFGWILDPANAMGFTAWHSGGHPGYVSRFYRFTEKDICLIMLSNAAPVGYNKLIARIHSLLQRT